MDAGSASLTNVHEINEAFTKWFHDGKLDKTLIKYASALMQPFAQMFQHAYHSVAAMNPEVRKAVIQGYHELMGAFSGMGIHFHDIRVLETKPNPALHNERGIGCQDALIRPIFEERGKAKKMAPPLVSEIIYLGYESDIDGVDSARSEVRVFYG